LGRSVSNALYRKGDGCDEMNGTVEVCFLFVVILIGYDLVLIDGWNL
jgi:hypothetical protein